VRLDLELVDPPHATAFHRRRDPRRIAAESDEVGEARRPERAQRRDDEQRLEQVRLALSVITGEDVERRARRQLEPLQVANPVEAEVLDAQR
jgi:hypothetical protein